MLLAGNGPSATYQLAQPKHQVLAPTPKHVAQEAFRRQPLLTPPCSALSSPMSVSSHPMGQSCGGTMNDVLTKNSRGSTTPVDQAPKAATSVVHVAGTPMTHSGSQIFYASAYKMLLFISLHVLPSSFPAQFTNSNQQMFIIFCNTIDRLQL